MLHLGVTCSISAFLLFSWICYRFVLTFHRKVPWFFVFIFIAFCGILWFCYGKLEMLVLFTLFSNLTWVFSSGEGEWSSTSSLILLSYDSASLACRKMSFLKSVCRQSWFEVSHQIKKSLVLFRCCLSDRNWFCCSICHIEFIFCVWDASCAQVTGCWPKHSYWGNVSSISSFNSDPRPSSWGIHGRSAESSPLASN